MAMNFYGFLTNHVLGREPSPEEAFARRAVFDREFPVRARYHEIKRYVLTHAEYADDYDTFNALWNEYCDQFYSKGKQINIEHGLIRLVDIAFREGFDRIKFVRHVTYPVQSGVKRDFAGIWCVEAEHEKEIIEYERRYQAQHRADNLYGRGNRSNCRNTQAVQGKEEAKG